MVNPPIQNKSYLLAQTERYMNGASMNALLLKDIEFEDLLGTWNVISKGTAVIIDDFDDTLVIIPGGPFEYIVKVEREDYRKYREMN